MQFTTYGSVRGQGKVFSTIQEASNSLDNDRRACARKGGYSDRYVVAIVDGFLRQIDSDTGEVAGFVWPSWGKSTGAVRAE